MEASEDDLVFENGKIFVKGAPAKGKTFAEVAGYAYIPVPLPAGLEPGLSEEAFFEPTNNTYPFGCHITMLEIDRDTGEPRLLKLVAVDDAGTSDQPADRRGPDSRRPGAGHRPGADRRGRLQLGRTARSPARSWTMRSRARPTSLASSWTRTVTPTPVNPLGAKGVGEAGTLGSTPSIVCAAVDALSEFGVKHIDMMLRPEKLWRIIQALNRGREAGRDPDRIRLPPRHVGRRRDQEAAATPAGSCSPAGTASCR